MILLGCAIALAALLATLPRQAASTRHAIWMLALIAIPLSAPLPLLLPPIYIAATPAPPAIPWLTITWILGATFQLGHLAFAYHRLLALKRNAVLDPELQHRTDLLGNPRGVRIARANVTSALLAGLGTPTILLPPGDVDDAILLHELAHARRRDDFSRALQLFVSAVFFFHPAIWLIVRRLDFERELACDQEAALRCGPASYVEALCRAGTSAIGLRASLAVASSALHRRVDALLDHPVAKTRCSLRAVAASIALIVLAAAACLPLVPSPVVAVITEDQALDGALEFGRGMSLYNAGYYDESIAHFRRSIALDFEAETSARWIELARAGEAGRR